MPIYLRKEHTRSLWRVERASITSQESSRMFASSSLEIGHIYTREDLRKKFDIADATDDYWRWLADV